MYRYISTRESSVLSF